MKKIAFFLAFCFISNINAQYNERFYKGTNGKKMKQKGQNIDLETCDNDSYTTLSINSSREVVSETKKFKGSCPSPNDIQLSDKGFLKLRVSPFSDTLHVTKYQDNGRLVYQKSITKPDISHFQSKVIPYDKGGFVVSYITYPKEGNTLSSVGYAIFDANGTEIARKTVDELADASPFSILLEGSDELEFYVLQGTNMTCGRFKLHKVLATTKMWTSALTYDVSCDNMQLQSFAISNQKDRVGLLFVGTSSVNFSKYYMVNNVTGSIMPTNFDISTRVRYNTKTAFGQNSEVYFARMIDYNTANGRVPDRSTLEILRFDINQNTQSRKRYYDFSKKDTDTLPQLEDMLVSNSGTIFISGSRLKKTWVFSDNDNDSGFGATSEIILNATFSTYIRQVVQQANKPTIEVEVESNENRELQLDFLNSTGQIVQTEKRTVDKGVNTIPVNFGSQVAGGTFTVQISNIVSKSPYKFKKL
jgi:hypothetical protein